MRRTYRPRFKATPIQQFRFNRDIRVPEVRLVDEHGQNIGVVSTEEALRRAEAADLDLVEVSPLANPPVAKILSFSQFKYRQDKEVQKQKSKQKKQETKGIRLSLRISQHDQEMRLEQATRFFEQGHKLKLELPLRGREHQHTDLAVSVMESFIKKLKERFNLTIEQPLQKQGGRLSVICFSSGKVNEKKSTEEPTENSSN